MAEVRRKEKVPQIRSLKAVLKSKEEQKEPLKTIEVSWSNNYFKQEILKETTRALGFSILCRRYSDLEIRNFIESLSYKVQS